eukprot:GHRR01022058.1.p2 GENE.GHRR01022058.1~~GHRR01022058.1.p2  ORF type:complete len:129 (+),score=18.05 GHRR01022058.1:56-442(+)
MVAASAASEWLLSTLATCKLHWTLLSVACIAADAGMCTGLAMLPTSEILHTLLPCLNLNVYMRMLITVTFVTLHSAVAACHSCTILRNLLQVKAFMQFVGAGSSHGHNARPLQPLNGRILEPSCLSVA